MALGKATEIAFASEKELRDELANELFSIETSGMNYLERDYLFTEAEIVLSKIARKKRLHSSHLSRWPEAHTQRHKAQRAEPPISDNLLRPPAIFSGASDAQMDRHETGTARTPHRPS